MKKPPFMLAFELLKNGQLKPIWSVKRDGGTAAYLSSDGLSLLVFENIQEQLDTAITLYKRGKKVRSYKVIDFGIKTHMLKPYPCSRKDWVHAKSGSVSQEGNIISIRSVDGKKHAIDVSRHVKIR